MPDPIENPTPAQQSGLPVFWPRPLLGWQRGTPPRMCLHAISEFLLAFTKLLLSVELAEVRDRNAGVLPEALVGKFCMGAKQLPADQLSDMMNAPIAILRAHAKEDPSRGYAT